MKRRSRTKRPTPSRGRSLNLYKKVGEDAQLQQFKCVEFVEELMYGHLRKNPLPGPALERAKREAEERAKEE